MDLASQTNARNAPWWHRPVGWPMFAAAGIPSLYILWLGLYPSLYYIADVLFLGLLWFGVVVAYAVRLTVRDFRTVPGNIPVVPWRRDGMLFLIPLATTLLIAFRIPLRLGFLTARPGLTRLVNSASDDGVPRLSADQRCGIYVIAGNGLRQCHIKGRIILTFTDDPESGFIYSPNGIDDLCYNEGSKGHLFGNWYWMVED